MVSTQSRETETVGTGDDERSIHEVDIKLDFADFEEKLKNENIQARA